MKCAICGNEIPVDHPVLIHHLESPPIDSDSVLVFCMRCEDEIPDASEIHMLANKEMYFKD